MLTRTLLIRADADSDMGVGHVMRCGALAQAWQEAGGKVFFALAAGVALESRLRSWGSEVLIIDAEPGSEEDAAQTQLLCRRYGASWLCIDGYHFPDNYYTRVGDGIRLLLMDDYGDRESFHRDLILNANPNASETLYYRQAGLPCLLLGVRYALLRREFLQFERAPVVVPDLARRILITFGGADPENVTLKVMQALQQLQELHLDLTVVIGAVNPNRESINAAATTSPHTVRVLANVENMPQLMSQSDLAISAGGGTCYELAFMQVPMFLITTAQNQEPTVKAFGEAGAAIDCGWFHALKSSSLAAACRSLIGSSRLRQNLIEKARQMVDGRGAERVVEAMCAFEEANK